MSKEKNTERLIHNMVLCRDGGIKYTDLIHELVVFFYNRGKDNEEDYITDCKEWFNIIKKSSRLNILKYYLNNSDDTKETKYFIYTN